MRAVTIADRFALVEPDSPEHNVRMLGVSELEKETDFNGGHLMNHGTFNEDIRTLGRYVCLPVTQAVVKRIGTA